MSSSWVCTAILNSTLAMNLLSRSWLYLEYYRCLILRSTSLCFSWFWLDFDLSFAVCLHFENFECATLDSEHTMIHWHHIAASKVLPRVTANRCRDFFISTIKSVRRWWIHVRRGCAGFDKIYNVAWGQWENGDGQSEMSKRPETG